MTYRPRNSVLFALCLLLPAIPTTNYAQQGESCFNLFDDLTDPTFSCADANYFVFGANGGNDVQFFGDSDTGLLGADFDGFDIFDPDDPELAPPDNLLDPFFSDIQHNQTNIQGKIDSFIARHRGSVSMGARDSQSQSAQYGSQSRITFIPFTTDGSTDPVDLDFVLDFDFTLADPSENAGGGSALAGAGVQIIGDDPLEPLFDFEGLAELDLEFDDDPEFFGDFDGPASDFEPSGPGIDDEFDINVGFDMVFPATPGQPLTLDTDTFGSIFTDGFESGDTSAWSSSSVDTFVFSVSSDDPNVRFTFVTDFLINAGLNDAWFNPATAGQGFFIIVFPVIKMMFVAMFTFDTELPDPATMATLGWAGQRWFTAFGPYEGDSAVLDIEITSDGVFDSPEPVVSQVPDGTLTVEFNDCAAGTITYNIPSIGRQGVIPIQRLADDNEALCEELNAN